MQRVLQVWLVKWPCMGVLQLGPAKHAWGFASVASETCMVFIVSAFVRFGKNIFYFYLLRVFLKAFAFVRFGKIFSTSTSESSFFN